MHASQRAVNPDPSMKQPLQFVAVEPNARRRWLGSTRVVRSNAARYQWKELKDVKPRGRKSKVLPELAESGHQVTPITERGQEGCITIDGDLHVDLPVTASAGLEVMDVSLRHSPRSPSYYPYPSTLPTEIVGSLFHFICQIAPQVCGSGADSDTPVEMIRQLLSHPGTFHAGVFASASLQDDLRPSSLLRTGTYRTVLEACRLIAITNAKNLIAKVNSVSSKTRTNDIQLLISMVTALSTQSSDDETSKNAAQQIGPRQGPFRKLDALDRLGSRRRYQNIHTNAAVRLIELARGIDAVPEFHRLTNSSLSIILATRLQMKPQLPCRLSNSDFEEVFENYWTSGGSEIITSPEGLIQDVAELDPGLSQHLLLVIGDLLRCVRMTDSLLHRSDLNIHFSYLIDARKWTQHQLINLQSASELNTMGTWPSQQVSIYEIIRLGLNVFSLLAVYPLPLSGAPFATLAAKLAALLEMQPLELSGHSMLHLSLWASTMGALAAIGTRNRASFVNLVARQLQWLDIHSWTHMKVILEGYLWYAEVSDFDGQYLWFEAHQNAIKKTSLGVRELPNRSAVEDHLETVCR